MYAQDDIAIGSNSDSNPYAYRKFIVEQDGVEKETFRIGKASASSGSDAQVFGVLQATTIKWDNGTSMTAAASGGGYNSSYQLNASTATSGNSWQITAADGTTTYAGSGHTYGDRRYDWVITETLYSPSYMIGHTPSNTAVRRAISPKLWINGYIGASSSSSSDRNSHGYFDEGGHIGGHIHMYRPGFLYKFTKLYWSNGGSTSESPYNMSSTNWTSSSEHRWAIFGSNDASTWDTLGCFGSSGSTGWTYNGVSSVSVSKSSSPPYGLSNGGYNASGMTTTISFTNTKYYSHYMIKNIGATGNAYYEAALNGMSPYAYLRCGMIVELMWG